MRILTGGQQVAAHLREELARGRWGGWMPGQAKLALELGCSGKVVKAALAQLEHEGLLEARGPRRRRRVVAAQGGAAARPLRLAILAGEPADRRLDYMVELRHELLEAGHTVFFAERSLVELGLEVGRVERLVRRTAAEAWVVGAGSREVLEWFAGQDLPAFALFGRRGGLPLAAVGPDKAAAMAAAARALLELGHRRIVLLARERRRLPQPGTPERAFLAELAAHGVATGDYHFPGWEETAEGLQVRLESLFRITPPTALIVDEAPLFAAVYHFLAGQGRRVPGDVSLVCTDASPDFAWCRPTVAHIRWNSGPVVRRIVRWAANIGSGKTDHRQSLTPAEFVPGGTIGPVVGGGGCQPPGDACPQPEPIPGIAGQANAEPQEP
ncbi:MAG: substrate-binding domain-containing protein [Akkermansiaceae bacterium]|nr:substrate-binding domain-containing protein [Akkermansiaceae bacterium]